MRDSSMRDGVVKAARACARARELIDSKGGATNATWDLIERKENAMLRAVERLAGLKRLTLGVRDSE